MSTSYLSAPHFHDEAAAFKYVEARVWPTGACCPRCGTVERIGLLKGKSTRHGVYKCYECRKPFTVRIGTIFEDSKVALHLWLQAIYLVAASKKGISANQLHRVLGVTLKTAWFMGHRIRLAMQDERIDKLGSDGTLQIVEADEMYHGRIPKQRTSGSHANKKQKIVALVERKGKVRAFHVPKVNADTLKDILTKNIDKDARLMTDSASYYQKVGKEFASHETVNHTAGEYVRGDVTTNNVEGFFGVLKRGIAGVYQHVSPEHLHRYLSEFEFRFNNRKSLGIEDSERASNLVAGIVGKRLTYQTVS